MALPEKSIGVDQGLQQRNEDTSAFRCGRPVRTCSGHLRPSKQSGFLRSGKITAETNSAIIRGAYDAFSGGDIASVFAIFAEDILWHVPGRGPLSREYRGHSDVRGFFERFMALSGGTFRIRIDEILAEGDRVVVLCTETAQRAGRTWSSPQVHVWTIKDGRAIAFWEFEGDQQGEDEFWSIRD